MGDRRGRGPDPPDVPSAGRADLAGRRAVTGHGPDLAIVARRRGGGFGQRPAGTRPGVGALLVASTAENRSGATGSRSTAMRGRWSSRDPACGGPPLPGDVRSPPGGLGDRRPLPWCRCHGSMWWPTGGQTMEFAAIAEGAIGTSWQATSGERGTGTVPRNDALSASQAIEVANAAYLSFVQGTSVAVPVDETCRMGPPSTSCARGRVTVPWTGAPRGEHAGGVLVVPAQHGRRRRPGSCAAAQDLLCDLALRDRGPAPPGDAVRAVGAKHARGFPRRPSPPAWSVVGPRGYERRRLLPGTRFRAGTDRTRRVGDDRRRRPPVRLRRVAGMAGAGGAGRAHRATIGAPGTGRRRPLHRGPGQHLHGGGGRDLRRHQGGGAARHPGGRGPDGRGRGDARQCPGANGRGVDLR